MYATATSFQPKRVGDVENKNNSPFNIRFFDKTSDTRNFFKNIRSDVKTSAVATLLASVTQKQELETSGDPSKAINHRLNKTLLVLLNFSRGTFII